MIIEILIFFLLALLSSWEEIQQLIQRGSWDKEIFWIPIWETDWNSKLKLFDSHHIAFGLFVMVMFIFNYLHRVNEWWLIPVYWFVFFYFRNIGTHILFRKNNIELKYLIPIKFWKRNVRNK